MEPVPEILIDSIEEKGLSATIRDVAKKAQVGIATVSRVMNDSPSVSPQTRAKVKAAIKALDYVPNPAARNLSRGSSHTISVILPYLTFPSFIERLRGVQEVIEPTEYDLVLYSANNPERRDHLFNVLTKPSRTDGIIIVSILPDREQLETFLDSNVPVVLVDAYHPDLISVYVNNMVGGRIATNHLINLNHRKIGFVSDYLVNDFRFSAMADRFMGYKDALKRAGIEFRPEYHREVPHDRKAARQAALDLLSLEDPPTAIFASSDMQGVGVLEAVRDMGLSVPKDISVIGFDGVRDSEYLNMTTVKQPLFESGVIGSSLLVDLLGQDANAVSSVEQSVELIQRRTTRTLR